MTFYCKRCSQDNKRGLHADTDTWLLTTAPLLCYSRTMALSERQLLDSLSRTPFVDSAELAPVLGEAHATVHRRLSELLADCIIGRVSHGTAHLPSSHRYYLTVNGIRHAAGFLGFETPSDFVRAYPVSREWLTLLIRRMDAVAAVYRIAASLSPGIDGLRSHVEFHRRGRFDATITLHDGRSFGIVRQGLALRRRSLYDRLRAIADATPGPAQRPPQLHPVPGPPRPGPGTCAALTATPRPARAMRQRPLEARDASNHHFRRA